jgi:glycosyltransferase involved in cell wall biosynthesis
MESLNIRSETMLGTSHSWSVTMRGLLSAFKDRGHKLYLKSINGRELIQNKILEDIDKWHPYPDLDIAYTLPVNFASRFDKKSKIKAAIYNYESSILPREWLSELKHVDYIFPSSDWTRNNFIANGWDHKKCVTIPHGIDPAIYNNKNKFLLKNNKKFRFLNVSIPHFRKNINLVLEAYYAAFKEDDDVCLVIKTNLNKPKHKFECYFLDQLMSAQKKFGKKLPTVEVVVDTLEDITPLYNSCNAVVSASSSEGFGLPLLEGLALDKIIIAPRCTGQLDFLNNSNSLLVNTKLIDADERYQYWKVNKGARIYMPDVEHLSQQMLRAYKDYDSLSKILFLNNQTLREKYTWNNAAEKIESLIK